MQVLTNLQYNRIRELDPGVGKNSKVYEIDEPQLGGVMAAKEIVKTTLVNPMPDYFAEAKMMFATQHPNIVPIQYASEAPATFSITGQMLEPVRICLVMPFFKNGSVAKMIANGPLPCGRAVNIAIDVLAALGFVHVRQTVHFDVKPSNVMISDAGATMLADFGQARKMTGVGVATAPSTYWLVPPPEVIQTGKGTLHVDVYQCGLLLYRMVNGGPFWKEQVDRAVVAGRGNVSPLIVNGKFPNRNAFMPHVPARVRTLIRKSLKVQPNQRFQTAAEFKKALANVRPTYDWSVQHRVGGAVTWHAVRPDQPDLVVTLQPEPGGTWSTHAATDGASGVRAIRPKEFCKRGLKRADATRLLDEVFQNL